MYLNSALKKSSGVPDIFHDSKMTKALHSELHPRCAVSHQVGYSASSFCLGIEGHCQVALQFENTCTHSQPFICDFCLKAVLQ